MADEAATTIVLKMRDEASAKMDRFGDTTGQVTMESLQLQVALTAVGGALNAVGGLLGQIDHPAAKVAQTFLMFGGALFSAAAAIGTMLPVIKSLITSLKALAVAKAIVAALSGPAGWASIGIGLGVAAGATAAIYGMSGGFSPGGLGGGRVTNINISDTVITDENGIRKLSRQITDAQRSDEAKGR